MNSVLRIFRKDVRRLWPRIVLVVGIEAATRWVQPAGPSGVVSTQGGILGIETLAQWYLIASAIHEERLVGDRQYWLTRPVSWRALLAAKLLFFLVFIHLPVLTADVCALIARGESPAAHWAGLAMVQFFTMGAVLCGAVVAAVSASMAQFVGELLAVVMIPVLIAVWLASLILRNANMNWGGVEWLRFTMETTLAIAGTSAILALQYSARRTDLSRWILGVGAVAVGLTTWMPAWHAAFRLQSRLGEREPDAAIRIVQDAPRGGLPTPLPVASWSKEPSVVEVPILITGVPAGMALWSDRIVATGALPGGRVWSSGWDSLNRLGNSITSGTAISETVREEGLLPGADPWLYLNVDPYFARPDYRAGRELHATVGLTLLSAEEVTPLTRGGQPTRVSGGGLCWLAGNQNTAVGCTWPSPAPAYAAVRIRSSGSGASGDVPILTVERMGMASYGPCSGSGGLWQDAGTSLQMSDEPSEVFLVTRRAVAHFEREIDIHPTGGAQP